MANLKISQLNDGNPAAVGDQLPINRAGTNFRVTAESIAALVPTPTPTTLGGVESQVAVAGTFLTGISTAGVPTTGTAVTSVAGTANQISVATGTSTAVLSIPSTFIAPGSIAATTTLASGANGGTAGQLILSGSTSGTATITAPAIAGTTTNFLTTSNGIGFPDGTAANPSMTFSSSGNDGFWKETGFHAVHCSINGSAIFTFFNSYFCVNTNIVYGWGSSAANPDTALSRIAGGVAAFGTGAVGSQAGWMQWAGQKRVSTQFDKTNDAALGNVTGLSVNVVAGRTYSFRAVLHTNTGAAAGGTQFAIAGTATATAIIYQAVQESMTGVNIVPGAGRGTALGTAVANSSGTTTAQYTTIDGLITVNAAGTLTVQFAQFTSNGTASSVLVGSTFFVYDTP